MTWPPTIRPGESIAELTPLNRDELATSLAAALKVAGWRLRPGFVSPAESDREGAALAGRMADALLLANLRPFRGPPMQHHTSGGRERHG